MAAASPIQVTNFRELERWDVKYFTGHIVSKYPLVPLSKIVYEHNEKIRPAEYPDQIFKILGVNNTAGIFHAYDTLGKKIKQPYKKVSAWDFAYNPYRINVGSIGLVPEEHGDGYISPAYIVFGIDETKILPEIFLFILKSDFFNGALRAATAGSVRMNLTYPLLRTLKVPTPPLEAQQKIANYWQRASQDVLNWELQIQEWKDNIAKNILENFSIKIDLGNILPKVFICHFQSNERWGANFNRYSWDLKSLIRTDRYPKAPLGEYAWINPRSSHQLKADDKVTFIPMESVDDKDGYICKPETKKFSQVKSGFTRFRNGDVIWAKITPCMQNGKSAIVSNLINYVGFGSTEFHVIRTKNASNLRSEYIHLLLRMPQIRRAATRYFVGSAGQQRVPKEFLEKFHIPIMPIDDQNNLISLVQIERKKIENQRRKLISLRKESKKTVEEMILGLRSVEGI